MKTETHATVYRYANSLQWGKKNTCLSIIEVKLHPFPRYETHEKKVAEIVA